MNYDPIKFSLGTVFNKSPFLRKVFYLLLDILLLRAWHIKKAVASWKKQQNKPVSIIDAGCGFGQYSYYLARQNAAWNVLGIDVKQEQVADCNSFAKQIGFENRLSFAEGDLTTFVAEKPADMILSVDVMEHILDDVQVFKNFAASLQTNGLLLISTPSNLGGSDVHEEDGESFIGEHVRDGYSIEDITAKLQMAGFTNIEAAYSYGTAGHISWILSMKLPISVLNISKLFFILLPFYYLAIFWFCLILNAIDVLFEQKQGSGLIVKAYKA
ncbi:MAG: class I SAM-dependent methyltransferase [Bacteroidales bacterium]|nr:class I SAM-dependent methyltransferase [Bacteroidales bacterium]